MWLRPDQTLPRSREQLGRVEIAGGIFHLHRPALVGQRQQAICDQVDLGMRRAFPPTANPEPKREAKVNRELFTESSNLLSGAGSQSIKHLAWG